MIKIILTFVLFGYKVHVVESEMGDGGFRKKHFINKKI